MMKVIASVSGFSLSDRPVLVPYRLVIPSFLHASDRTAKMMVNDLVEDAYCDDAWAWDDVAPWSGSDLLWSAIKNMDWGNTPVLEYDWDELDRCGDKQWIPWELWQAAGDTKRRAPDLEPFICGDPKRAEAYAKGLSKEEWKGWTLEELGRNPCWAFYYAKDVCKGRLPEVLDNMMTMLSFQDPDNPWVKRYFKTKRYRRRNRKALAAISG